MRLRWKAALAAAALSLSGTGIAAAAQPAPAGAGRPVPAAASRAATHAPVAAPGLRAGRVTAWSYPVTLGSGTYYGVSFFTSPTYFYGGETPFASVA